MKHGIAGATRNIYPVFYTFYYSQLKPKTICFIQFHPILYCNIQNMLQHFSVHLKILLLLLLFMFLHNHNHNLFIEAKMCVCVWAARSLLVQVDVMMIVVVVWWPTHFVCNISIRANSKRRPAPLYRRTGLLEQPIQRRKRFKSCNMHNRYFQWLCSCHTVRRTVASSRQNISVRACSSGI